MVGVGHQFLAQDKPVNFAVGVEYSSSYGEIFKEKLTQNLEYLRQTTVPGKSTEEHLGEITKVLTDINWTFDKVKGCEKDRTA